MTDQSPAERLKQSGLPVMLITEDAITATYSESVGVRVTIRRAQPHNMEDKVMATQEMLNTNEDRGCLTGLKKIVIGHDFSDAADCAFADTMALAGRFNARIIVAHAREGDTDKTAIYQDDQQVKEEMNNLINRIARAGYSSQEVIRSGRAVATLCDVVDEESADLLIVGAYGNGSKDRATLGSTAELLLRSIPCPVLTYGPKFGRPLFQRDEPFSILVPIELPCDPRCLSFAIHVAKLFKAKLEILHVVDMDRAISMPHAFQDMQYTCENIAACLRAGDIEVAGSLLFGKPDTAIVSRCRELQCSFILMPLETRGHLSSDRSDNIAAKVIRTTEVPVMTYRIN
jgi:nucleotide-binding universal stress UspA family protein